MKKTATLLSLMGTLGFTGLASAGAPVPVPVPVGQPYSVQQVSDGLYCQLIASADACISPQDNYASMHECGGSVELVKRGSQVNLVFRNIVNCSNFTILSANGEDVGYRNIKLQGEDRNRFGSFTLPSSILEGGYNEVLVEIKSNSGKHSQRIMVSFREHRR